MPSPILTARLNEDNASQIIDSIEGQFVIDSILSRLICVSLVGAKSSIS